MAVIDTRLKFGTAQAVTTTAASTDTIDLGSGLNVGVGQPLYFVVQVTTALDATDEDETYAVELQTADNAAFDSGLQTLLSIPLAAGSPAGTLVWVAVPNTNKRHLRARYVHGGTTPTGSYTSFITSEHPPAWEAFPDADN
jgi:hypothetical protein